MPKIKNRFNKRASGPKRWLAGVVLLFLLVISGLALLETTGSINLFSNKKPAQTDNHSKDPERNDPGSPGLADKGSTPEKPKDKDKDGARVLLAPTGDFVSNHSPNLDGQPAPSSMESVCTTTPGATCSISFTKNGIVKKLPAQTADSEGSVYWGWNLRDYDITEGLWEIEAKASLGSQTKTTKDNIQLNVRP